MKRPQILIADSWACFNGQSYGEFHDIDQITMFADYRVPQACHNKRLTIALLLFLLRKVLFIAHVGKVHPHMGFFVPLSHVLRKQNR